MGYWYLPVTHNIRLSLQVVLIAQWPTYTKLNMVFSLHVKAHTYRVLVRA